MSTQEEADKKLRELASRTRSISEVIIDHAETPVEGAAISRDPYYAVMGRGGTAVFSSFQELEEHVTAVLEKEQLEDALRADKREAKSVELTKLEQGRSYVGFQEPPPVLRSVQKATAVRQDRTPEEKAVEGETAPHMRERIAHKQIEHLVDERLKKERGKTKDVKMAASKKPAYDPDRAHRRKGYVLPPQPRRHNPFGPRSFR